ncbi:hypothetical protein FDI76_gp028 [Serratia phage vB_Sru_IME250]|uniref:Uncharacterized protein n=1 Tax=Serratia phage vB_Sru_IME250 TaxID=1852640 RepID=A0A1J0MFR3_9CAUD|nr:hypothetical protein FDI76_gp028 [Serratia phage vB_Sru_IME250]ANM47137.1 hypothetical protein [Serratia phage vB_Sru_IME250]APD20045.1 hypothetical protein [Serratia phage vB_Sru_IME250]
MFKFLKNLFVKELSLEVKYLVDAIDNDLVTVAETNYVYANPVLYNGVRVYAYTVNTPSGYTVDLDDRRDCLPRHEAKAVYRALCAHTKRFRERNAQKREIQDREFSKAKLGGL